MASPESISESSDEPDLVADHIADDAFYTFQEYEMFYATTEKVTEWRQSLNRFNYSISSAIVVGIAAIANWSLTTPRYATVGVASLVFIPLLGIQFCSAWKKQIGDYKQLNNAKFKVLAHMAPRLAYSSDYDKDITPPCPFDREWKELEAERATTTVKGLNIKALSASQQEYNLPRGFQAIYALTLGSAIFALIVNWGNFTNPLVVK